MPSFFYVRCFRAVFLLIVLVFFAALPCFAQESGDTGDADLGEVAAPINAMRGVSPKTVAFVFDVSGSMKSDGNLRRAREATIVVLREAVRPGDHVVLFTFGADRTKVFDKVIQSGEDKTAAIALVPTQPENGAGTNIRKPHHESLKIAEATLPRDTFLLLLTDSFNDEPKPTDAAYPDYLNYYTPGGQLTKYPKTAQNRDYERLLFKLGKSGKLHQYGIGISLDSNGRPIERLPQAAPPPSENADAAPTQTSAPAKPDAPTSPVVWIALGTVAAALVGVALFVLPNTKASVFRLTGGPSGTKDFNVKSGQSVRLGGEGASVAYDAYALPGASVPVAHIRAVRGQMVLVPANAPANANAAAPASVPGAPGAPRNQTDAARVYHNGIALEGETPLDFGDEVRIALPSQAAVGGTLAREFRLKVSDPKKV